MRNSSKMKFNTLSEAEFEPVLKLLQGGDPKLAFLVNPLTAKAVAPPPGKVGRNEPCPCGSGKKYKQCCLEKHEAADHTNDTALKAKQKEQGRLIKRIKKAFGLPCSFC